MIDKLLYLFGTGFIKLASSFVGTWGFAVVMHAPKRAWFPASLVGGVAYEVGRAERHRL